MAIDTQQAYAHCQRITKRHARNFYYAFRTLPPAKRRAIYAVYAFCRICDDIADDDIPLAEKTQLLIALREQLHASRKSPPSDPIFAALRHAAQSFAIPYTYFEQVIDGVEVDLTQSRFADWEELRSYCYKVASVVGLICIEVFGYEDEQARDYAVDMGIAMQLTNILRDVKEDAERGRIYIPQDEMRRFGYTERELNAGVVNDEFRALMAHQAERARRHFQSSEPLFPLISPDSRACPKLMHATYASLLGRIEHAGYDVFQKRIGLNPAEKLLLLGRLWIEGLSLSQMTSADRNQRP